MITKTTTSHHRLHRLLRLLALPRLPGTPSATLIVMVYVYLKSLRKQFANFATSRPLLRHLPHRLALPRHRGTLRVSLKRVVLEQLLPRPHPILPTRLPSARSSLHSPYRRLQR
jgi:hypothetical protein